MVDGGRRPRALLVVVAVVAAACGTQLTFDGGPAPPDGSAPDASSSGAVDGGGAPDAPASAGRLFCDTIQAAFCESFDRSPDMGAYFTPGRLERVESSTSAALSLGGGVSTPPGALLATIRADNSGDPAPGEAVIAAASYTPGAPLPKTIHCEATIVLDQVGGGTAQLFAIELSEGTSFFIQTSGDVATTHTQATATVVFRTGGAADNTYAIRTPIVVGTPTRLTLTVTPNGQSGNGGTSNDLGTLRFPSALSETTRVLFGVTAIPNQTWSVRYDDLVCWKE
jgi:hypothetical protein